MTYVIIHKKMPITDTASESEAGAWNLLFGKYPQLLRKSRKELLDYYGYEAKKTRNTKPRKGEYND